MSAIIDIEQPDPLIQRLRRQGRIGPRDSPRCARLSGGVSNRVVRLDFPDGRAWVLKQALPKLRVQVDWFSDPRRIDQEARGLIWLGRLAPPGAVPPLLFHDPDQHLLAMEAVPQPHENWKSALLAGRVDPELARQFGELLGAICCRSSQNADEIEPLFRDRSFFDSLRIEPYYRYTAAQHPRASRFFFELIDETLAQRVALTHGDYSPKNILVRQSRLVLLDHEVIHFGDPAFDIGFSLTHFLSKANHLPERREQFVNSSQIYWQSYRQSAGALARSPAFESRAVRHTLACLLARVDGRSPLEYLSADKRERQRRAALQFIADPPRQIPELLDRWLPQLDSCP